MLDLKRHRALIPAHRVLKGARDQRGRLFDVSPRQSHRAFAGAVEQLGVYSVEPTLYSLRR
eukprot:3541296-Pyramimonas_sp.AAC.1